MRIRGGQACAWATLWLLLAGTLSADEVIRIMAANITSGNGQNYDPGEGNRIFLGLKPDIALVQEMSFGDNSPATMQTWVNTNFGTGFQYFREVRSNGDIPNGIVSRYPIRSSGEWEDTQVSNREFAWARIDIPGAVDLWAVSVHFLTSGSTVRNTQATNLRTFIQQNVPENDYLVVGGDFNTDNRSESCLTTLGTLVRTTGPYPVDQNNIEGTNASRAKPYDWVMPEESLHALRTPFTVGSLSFPNGLVFDSRVFTPLSAVAPVQLGDSGATNMQHMAVIRAFLIPTNAAPLIAQGGSISRVISQNNHPTAFAAALTASDTNGDPLTWNISSPATNGTASLTPTTGAAVTLGYTPTNDFTGNDAFTVRVSDGQGGTATCVVSVRVDQVSAYDRWVFDSFAPLLSAEESTRWGKTANPDGDSYENFGEFALGRQPLVSDEPDIAPLEIAIVEDAVELGVLLRMDNSSTVVAAELQENTAPGSSGWTTLTGLTSLGDDVLAPEFIRRRWRLTGAVSTGSPQKFYRVIYRPL